MIGLTFGKLHFIHALLSVPVEISLSSKHRRKALVGALEQRLNGSAVANESSRLLGADRRDVA